MYACICAAVTDAAVEDAISRGADSPEKVRAETGAGSGCGLCRDHVCDMIRALTQPGTSAADAAT